MAEGAYFSFSASSVDANQDLIAKAKTLSGLSSINAKKIELYTSGSLAFSINGGPTSILLKDGIFYHLSLSNGDVLVSSLVVTQATSGSVFVSMVY